VYRAAVDRGGVAAMSDPWRKRCPKGHASIVVHNARQSFRCRSCERTYDRAPLDATEVPL